MTKMGLIETIGAILTGLGAVALWAFRRGAAKRDAEHGADYIDERKRQDGLDVGHGASDSERIKRLHDIANRNGKRKD